MVPYERGSFTKDFSCSDWVGEIFVFFFVCLVMGGGRQWDDWSHMEVWLNNITEWSIPDSVTVVVSETDHDSRKMMSLLCTAQTVWNKGLKKHWFPILINYGYGCILTRWTCLWLGTCNIIIRWQIIDFCRSGNNPRRVSLIVVNVYLRGRYLHVFEGVAYLIFKYFSLKIAFVFVSNRQKTI